MAPTYKLSYFSLCGLGESIRFLLHACGQEFEDHRVEDKEWPQYKPKMPMGKLPVLTIDGDKQLCQSKAIARYIANQHGMIGGNAWQNACIDMIVDRTDDLFSTLDAVYDAKNDEIKAAGIVKYLANVQPVLANLEKCLVSNGGGDGYMVGDKMTWADTTVSGVFIFISEIATIHKFEIPLDACPKLVALVKRVESNPAIAAYIAKRPETTWKT